ncbi:hypothetical protein Tco_0912725 [Tanacetum coccineum]
MVVNDEREKDCRLLEGGADIKFVAPPGLRLFLWGDREQLITSNNPTWCDSEWKALMGSCWSADPTERPFVLILCFLEGLFCAL